MAAVFSALFPVVLFIALGFAVVRKGWMGAAGVKDLGNLVFMVLTPALLFRTMSQVRVDQLNFEAVGVYFIAAGLVFFGVLFAQGLTCTGAARALACTFGNTIMIGVPMIGMLWGEAGLVQLFTLISIHSLVLLTGATVVFEVAAARESAKSGHAQPLRKTVLRALRNGIVHPIPLPIMAGVLWSVLGVQMPEVIDKPLTLMGQALGPLALLLVGGTLAQATVGQHLKTALVLAGIKNLVFPALMLGLGLWMGLQGLALAVMTCAAALPTGANVFMFAQRYNTSVDEITAEVATSTVLAMLTMVPVLMVLATLAPVMS